MCIRVGSRSSSSQSIELTWSLLAFLGITGVKLNNLARSKQRANTIFPTRDRFRSQTEALPRDPPMMYDLHVPKTAFSNLSASPLLDTEFSVSESF